MLRRFGCTNYKPFRTRVTIEVCPLTLFFGRNNSGKSALLRLPRLLLRALSSRAPRAGLPLEGPQGSTGFQASSRATRGSFPLEVEDVSFGRTFRDLVHGGAPHGSASFEIELDTTQLGSLDLSATVQNIQAVARPGEAIESTVISLLEVRSPTSTRLEWLPTPGPTTTYRDLGAVAFRGLLPEGHPLFSYAGPWRNEIEAFEDCVTHLGPLRAAARPTYETTPPRSLGQDGAEAVAWLMADETLEDRVAEWFEKNLDGWRLGFDQAGSASHCVLSRGSTTVNLCDSGQGMQQVLPVVVQQLLDVRSPSFLHLIEQPELHLHAAAQLPLADLFVDTALKRQGAVLVETHSENLLLRVRRRVAEGKIAPDQVSLWWVDERPAGDSSVQRIQIDANGEVDYWPKGVFSEGYEEVKALRRAARTRPRSMP
jgi:AAA ATPase domain/Protein of unknown function (DUF3696)